MDFKKGDHGTCPVVKVKHEIVEGNDTGYVEINADDFDSEKHELYKPGKKAAASDKPDYNDMTKADIGELLIKAKVAFDPDMKKADMVALAEAEL